MKVHIGCLWLSGAQTTPSKKGCDSFMEVAAWPHETLPEITVSENRSLCHPQMQVKALSSSHLLWAKDHLKQTEAKWKMWLFKFFLENMDTTSFRIKSIQLVISTQSKMLNHILHLWQQQRLCGEKVGTEVSCLHTTSFLALKKCGQCVAVGIWFKPLGF